MRAWGGPESRLRLSGLVSGNLKEKKKCRGGERGTCKIKDFGETLIVTWLEGFWDFELGKGCGYTL